MQNQKRKVSRFLVFMALSFVLVVSSLFIPNKVAQAATKKTSISTTTMTIPVGKLSDKVYWSKNLYQFTNGEKLSVSNPVKGATYQFTSSNSKVATVSKTGGYLTGVKAGSATITCTQTYKNKKTTIGKCKVTVKNASLEVLDSNIDFSVGSSEYTLYNYYAAQEPIFQIAYRNPKATYSLSSSSKGLTIKAVKNDATSAKNITKDQAFQQELKNYIGNGYFYGYQFTVTEAGTYTITVKETLNKKVRTVGSFKIVVKAASIAEENIDISLGNGIRALSLINYVNLDKEYHFTIKGADANNVDDSVLYLYNSDDIVYISGDKTGTGEVEIREGGAEGRLIGTVTINVVEVPCEDIIVYEKYSAYVGDDFTVDFELEPFDTTDKLTVESDNLDVVTVEYDTDQEEWIFTALKTGEVNITITCGDKKASFVIIVEEE